MSTLATDVAIIGGGLVGTSAALALRRSGLSVVVLDKGYCGAQASGVNYGGVRRQGRPLAQIPLSQRAHAIWPRLKELIGIDGEFLRSGHLKLARTEAEMAALETYAARVADLGLDLELMGHNGLRERYPWIAGHVAGASLCPGDGHANPRLVSAAFARAAERAGAHVMEHTPVHHVERMPDGFHLSTGAGIDIKARHVVNSAGAWAAPFAAAFGEPVPLGRIYPCLIVTEPVAPAMTVNIGAEGGGIYARQVERGNCIVGGVRGAPLPDADFSRPVGAPAISVMNRAAKLFPALRHAHAIRFWTGTEGDMPDRNPVIGFSATTPGLIHAFGFSGAGFQIAPGVGEVVADLIRDGRSTTPIDAFAIDRFVRTNEGSGADLMTEPQQRETSQ
ncbi:NAD(P)/FAD-dependent oxidoreductase [Microvirga brassicacearum]|uniref:FAD-binding oxidoreductase n=1 Tax=Microvirga brassicacearum TaxID=2580413 RepID=A0A5N3P9W9_9HYPH|nr:FAD-binding oxidoreductase [Microvirga brassicacearum]KAB0266494.1 FAD-binding oxidoreductase [Microvirga brassicacearum]